jgi:hypothetical protein
MGVSQLAFLPRATQLNLERHGVPSRSARRAKDLATWPPIVELRQREHEIVKTFLCF